MIISKNGSEIRSVDRWFEIAPPKGKGAQWVNGRSALECARAWFDAQSNSRCPTEIAALLGSHADTAEAILLKAEPECRIHFDKLGGEPRNADMAILADHPKGRLAINVEAKADESFGPLVSESLRAAIEKVANDEPTNAIARIQALASSILPPPSDEMKHLGELRYQLLTGIAGVLAYAIREKSDRAVFIVHEFVTNRTDDSKHSANAKDFDAFVTRMTSGRVSQIPFGLLVGPLEIPAGPLFSNPPPLYLGKAVRRLRP
jgi:hypothetical protein